MKQVFKALLSSIRPAAPAVAPGAPRELSAAQLRLVSGGDAQAAPKTGW